MKRFLKRIWEAPQKALAHIVIKLFKAEEAGEYAGAKLYFWRQQAGMSLSTHIFLPFQELSGTLYEENYIRHEYGHTIQSKYLGWFYLLVIGLPSLIWAGCFEGYRKKKKISYYSFYTEKWADKLGGVKREG